MSRRMLAVVLVLFSLRAGSAGASVYLIRPDGTGDFPTIQQAIDGALPGDTLDLDDGIFRGTGNRDMNTDGRTFTIRSRSGDSTACVIDCEGTPDSPHRAFLLNLRADPELLLERFTIRNGYAPNSFMGPVGGGIALFHSSPIMVGMVFEKNRSPRGGGGVQAEETDAVFTNCVFNGNSAQYSGGGICTGQLGNITITRCKFTGNQSGMRGGGIALQSGVPTVSGCTFTGNAAVLMGGGIACEGTGSPWIEQCTIHGNYAINLGGGVAVVVGSPTLYECLIYGNESPGGGGIACEQTPGVWFTRCTVSNNASAVGSNVWLDRSVVYLAKSIVSFGSAGSAFECLEDVSCSLTCCDVYGSEGGDYVGCIGDQVRSGRKHRGGPSFLQCRTRGLSTREPVALRPRIRTRMRTQGRSGRRLLSCGHRGANTRRADAARLAQPDQGPGGDQLRRERRAARASNPRRGGPLGAVARHARLENRRHPRLVGWQR